MNPKQTAIAAAIAYLQSQAVEFDSVNFCLMRGEDDHELQYDDNDIEFQVFFNATSPPGIDWRPLVVNLDKSLTKAWLT